MHDTWLKVLKAKLLEHAKFINASYDKLNNDVSAFRVAISPELTDLDRFLLVDPLCEGFGGGGGGGGEDSLADCFIFEYRSRTW